MKIPSVLRSAVFLAAVLAAGALHAADCRVDVVVDLTPAGAALPAPSPQSPAFYFPLASGFSQMGSPEATRVTPPRAETVERLFFPALAESNYRILTKQNTPSLLLVFGWGYVAPHVGRGAGASTQLSDNANETAFVRNLVGGRWLDTDPIYGELDPERDILVAAARLPRFFVTIQAFDYKQIQQHKRVLLWTAHASTEASGLGIADAMPTLIAALGPRLGKATAKPQLFGAPIIAAQ